MSFAQGIWIHQKNTDRFLSIQDFESYFRLKLRPSLQFQSSKLLNKLINKTETLRKKKQLHPDQLWRGTYFEQEILSGYQESLTIRWIGNEVGWGVFTRKDLPQGVFICEYGGIVRKKTRLDRKNPYCFEYALTRSLSSSYVIDAKNEGSIARFINHGENSNLVPMLATLGGLTHVIFLTKKPIARETQLLYNYGLSYWNQRAVPKNL